MIRMTRAEYNVKPSPIQSENPFPEPAPPDVLPAALPPGSTSDSTLGACPRKPICHFEQSAVEREIS
jgi:hypothetical protein